MRKLFFVMLAVAATLSSGIAHQNNSMTTAQDAQNMGIAPKEPNGVGRLDLRVVDEGGKPVRNVYAKLTSIRSDGFKCESWARTNTEGVAVLPPLHMGRLSLMVKAKGYRTQEIVVPTTDLSQPVRVTLAKK
ncbi:MAG: carboxypeptidase regulatory-like domain-containing protein [Pyrinomonadaceae bacterium]|nr:carboxypeptidase regulatory-like domain-containing protein [Pyrinomonadaceae bacterium]